jgi:mRNA-degrading endonuclease RelE of RelBE toxin-antitoxin system
MYSIQGVSRKIDKRFIKTMGRFSNEQVNAIEHFLQIEPKGNPASHWDLKKVARNVWQLDLPEGHRMQYTVDDQGKTVFILFIGTHDEAAAYLRGKM